MADKLEYQIVGRYMSGPEVTGYHMSRDDGKSGRYSREQVCYLVGRGQVVNCEGQLYKDKVLLRGKGMSIESLPVVSDKDGSLTRTESLGRIKRGVSVQDAMSQIMIVATLVDGRNAVGYVVKNAGGVSKKLKRDVVIQLAADGKIGNASINRDGDRVLLRGVGCKISELPKIDVRGEANRVSNRGQRKEN